MSISSLLDSYEKASLYSGANAAIWYSHHLANRLAKVAAREEDYVATLVTDGLLHLAERWSKLLEPRRIAIHVAGVFCHGHPQVAFGNSSSQVELADLLIVHRHASRNRSTARAILLQAKMSTDGTLALASDDKQLELYSKWPPFRFVTGGLASGDRDLNEKGKGSRYALILQGSAYPEQITWADQCPWAASVANRQLSAASSLAKLLGDMLLGKEGRPFRQDRPRDQWSRMILELLRVTGKRTYKRTNIGRGDTPRLAAGPTAAAGLMFMASGTLPARVPPQAHVRSFSRRFFAAAPLADNGGDRIDDLPRSPGQAGEGGVSTLIIETSEIND
ncbi:hypothetical protein B1992_00615 [Pseudoxanthomonas broegbernensis]|uniref:Uncharacterized protein n=1 Tax=Pseudoxanthomonas broegbernensis TaxID=83619 RepID=A0A7V8GPY6_9GAMM|nr:hypothetical protein [Pseudoxanthomonas broegbernensis]KAF1687975.1 hypothetical protein B1992_00615 [Pseudoxanthomonas broegbernensis]MBB6064989.1 hypothetical protein [Pseudoxanthomonas broegbernensis]